MPIYLSFVSWCSNWRATVLWLMKPCTYQNLLDSWDVKDHLTDPFDFKVAILIFSPSSSISRSRYWTKTRRPTSRQCPPTGGCPSGSRPSETWSPSARRCWLCSGRKRCLPDLSVRFFFNLALKCFICCSLFSFVHETLKHHQWLIQDSKQQSFLSYHLVYMVAESVFCNQSYHLVY